ncbi:MULTISPECIES: hypothetical protein [Burkholderia]|uniref:hypothetical protein n=1 Tax=Burkholderia TaxID=32008 RepID=UPI000A6C5237|nr:MULTISPECIES: hypothetical protein [Burkholderia]
MAGFVFPARRKFVLCFARHADGVSDSIEDCRSSLFGVLIEWFGELSANIVDADGRNAAADNCAWVASESAERGRFALVVRGAHEGTRCLLVVKGGRDAHHGNFVLVKDSG